MKKLHRLFSAFLCIILLFSFVISPIQVRAVTTPYFDPATALYGGVVIEGFKEGAKLVSSIIAPFIEDAIDSNFFKRCSDILDPDRLGQINLFTVAFNAFTDVSASTDGTQRIVVDSDVVCDVVNAYESVYGEIASDEVLTEDLEIYVPPDSIWSETELITSARLLSDGFGDLQSLNENVLAGNKISWQILQKVMSLSGYLRTDFIDDLVAEFGTLTSLDVSLTKELDDVEAWVNRLNSNLVSKMDTLTSSVGSLSTTLSGKLDTINTTLTTKLDALDGTVSVMDVGLYNQLVSLEQSIWDMEGSIWAMETTLGGKLDTINTTLSALGGLDTTVGTLNPDLAAKLDSIISTSGSILSTLTTEFTRIKSVLADISIYTFDGFYDLNEAVGLLNTTLSGKLDSVVSAIEALDLAPVVNVDMASVTTAIGGLKTALAGDLATINSSIKSLTSTVNTWDRTTIDRVMENLQQIKEYQINVRDTLQAELLKISGYEATINTNMKDYLQDVKDGLLSLQKNTVYRLQTVETAINNLPAKLGSLDDALLEQVEGIGTSLGLIAAPTVTTPDTSDLDDLEDKKIPLYSSITSGFDKGNEFFGFTIESLDGEVNGFLVAAKIFNEFADLSFFKKLLIASASIGMIGALLGMALDSAGFLPLPRRRSEAAAQSKARSRMERGLVVQ